MICRHPERDSIETDLRAGTSYRDIARRHHVNQHNDIAISERCY